MKNTIYLALILWLCTAATCSVKLANTSIPPHIETFYVAPFRSLAYNAPPDIGNTFSEEFKVYVRRQSRLSYTDTNPDVEFEGSVKSFQLTSIAPSANETTQLNRLTITIEVQYTDNQSDGNNWKNNFSFREDFGAEQNLADVQDQLIANIFEQLTQDVFNKAFGKW